MCKQRNLESLEHVECVLKEKYRNNKFTIVPLLESSLEFLERFGNGGDGKVVYYGLLTCGESTAVQVVFMDNKFINVGADNQIIEFFAAVYPTSNPADAHLQFRGWEITFESEVWTKPI